MSPYDVTPDDEPIDLAAVAFDDGLVEQLRRSLSPQDAVGWDDDGEPDHAFALLRVLQQDVDADLPVVDLPAGVTTLAPRQRRFGRTATIAAVTAGVLSIGGVAAAASSPGSPLGQVRSAVSSAVSNVVQAITPVGPAVSQPATEDKPSPKATPPGELVSAAARSASATTQIDAELDKAGRFLAMGKYSAAKGQLGAAGRKLPLVLDVAAHDRLAARLTAMRARLAGATHGHVRDDSGQGSSDSGKGHSSKGGSSKGGTSKGDSTPSSSGSSGSGSSGPGSSGSKDSGKSDVLTSNAGKSDLTRGKASEAPTAHPAAEVDPAHAARGTDVAGNDAAGHVAVTADSGVDRVQHQR